MYSSIIIVLRYFSAEGMDLVGGTINSSCNWLDISLQHSLDSKMLHVLFYSHTNPIFIVKIKKFDVSLIYDLDYKK